MRKVRKTLYIFTRRRGFQIYHQQPSLMRNLHS